MGNSIRPRLALTMGDVGGIGPEIVAKAVLDPAVRSDCLPVVVGNAKLLSAELGRLCSEVSVKVLTSLERLELAADRGDGGNSRIVYCYDPCPDDVANVVAGSLDALAGHAAFCWLVAAIDTAMAGQIDGIVTAPLNKKGLQLAGHDYPGHTEILASRCCVDDYAMMLYLPCSDSVRQQYGCGVAHVTLHTSLQSVFGQLTPVKIGEKIELVSQFLRKIGAHNPRIGVAALNPHGGEGGLLGDEEERVIHPAVLAAKAKGIQVTGPIPADALFRRALRNGEFDGLVAMYHDQGHIALKLWGWDQAVNITLGLPIVRTSPSHGTAYDIAGKGIATSEGMVAAVKMAATLAATVPRGSLRCPP